MSVDTNGWELAMLFSGLFGFVIQVYLLNTCRRSFNALQGVANGRRLIAKFHLLTGGILLFCHAVFIYFGVRLALAPDPPAYPTEFVINLVMFMGMTVGLLVIGIYDLRIRRALRH